MLEALVVGNYVLDPFPGGLSEWERGVCEGRRQVVLEILDMFQLGYQGAYEVINRVERMAKDEAGKESYAND